MLTNTSVCKCLLFDSSILLADECPGVRSIYSKKPRFFLIISQMSEVRGKINHANKTRKTKRGNCALSYLALK